MTNVSGERRKRDRGIFFEGNRRFIGTLYSRVALSSLLLYVATRKTEEKFCQKSFTFAAVHLILEEGFF